MKILLAPHPDDEVVNAYYLLKNKKVDKIIYLTQTACFAEITVGRVDDVRRAMAVVEKTFGVRCEVFNPPLPSLGYMDIMANSPNAVRRAIYGGFRKHFQNANIIYTPSLADASLTHIIATLITMAIAKGKIIMYGEQRLTNNAMRVEVNVKEKRRIFKALYPVQYALMKKFTLSLSPYEIYEEWKKC